MKALTALLKARREIERERTLIVHQLTKLRELAEPIDREIAVLETMAEMWASRGDFQAKKGGKR